MDLTPGEVLDGKYKIAALLGRGGMGAVYAGENVRIRRQVAIKVLHQGASGLSDALMRFEREAQAAGQIGSDHIAEVLDLGVTPGGDRYMVMEFLDGESLQARVERGRMDPKDVVGLIRQLLDGLAAAHKAGIIHRDLKPDNVFILKEKARRKDFVKILDFGISKFSALSGGSGQATRAGTVMGTPFYMSPEQAKSANEVDARSDLYSVGVVLYQAVTGQVPFEAQTFAELLFKIVFEAPPLPQSVVPSLDNGIVQIITKAMARAPSDRFQTADEFDAALAQWEKSDHSMLAAIPAPTSVQGLPLPASSNGSTIALDSVNMAPHLQSTASRSPMGAGTVALPEAMFSTGQPSASPALLAPPPAAPMPPGAANTGSSWGATGAVEPPPPAKRTGLIVGIAACLVVGACGAGFLLMHGKGNGATTNASKDSAVATVTAPAAPQPIQSAPVASAAPPVAPPADTTVATASAAASIAPPVGAAPIGGKRPVGATPAAAASAHHAAPTGKAVSDFGY